jgi:hypothetical protein
MARIEGAALSGLAAAEAIAGKQKLRDKVQESRQTKLGHIN